MAISASSTNVANIGPPQNLATAPVDLAAVGPLGETSGNALVVVGDLGAMPSSAQLPASLGTKAPSASLSVQSAGLGYETVAASQTAQVLGGTGGAGDYLSHLIVIPATTSPGNVLLLDNATSITLFPGGASSVASLAPITIPIGAFSVSGAWKVTTGANVSVVAFGDFAA